MAQDGRIAPTELRAQAKEFLHLLEEAMRHQNLSDLQGAEWTPVLDFLDGVSPLAGNAGIYRIADRDIHLLV